MRQLFVPVVLAAVVVSAACGGDSDSSDSDATKPASGVTTAAPQPAKLSPAELGDAVFGRAAEGMKQVTKLVESHPAAASVTPKVTELKESTIEQLVSLGRQYETMSVSDRAQVDAKVTAAFNEAANADWYKAYAKVTTLYTAEDAALAKQIQSFNIITQYAFFELLKKQDPAEAQRLGIR